MTILKTLLFTLIAPGSVAILFPVLLTLYVRTPIELEFGVWRYAGLPLTVFGALIYLSCAWDFATYGQGTPAPIDPPKTLVVRNLYRYVRNPMYVGVVTILIGEAVLFQSALLLLYLLAIGMTFHLFVVLYEEPKLKQLFGEEYTAYTRDAPRWIPRFGRR